MMRRSLAVRFVVLSLGVPVLAGLAVAGSGAAATGTPAALQGTTVVSTKAAVRGVAWKSDNSPAAGVKVRLRNIQTGRIEAAALTSEKGEFTFNGVGRGAYAIEVVADNGNILAVGQQFRIEPGETVATFVRLAARRSWFAETLSNTAAAVIAAASSAGVTAIGSQAPPVSPQ